MPAIFAVARTESGGKSAENEISIAGEMDLANAKKKKRTGGLRLSEIRASLVFSGSNKLGTKTFGQKQRHFVSKENQVLWTVG